MAAKKRKKKTSPPSVKQEVDRVEGQVIQAGRDVIITQPTDDERKDRPKGIRFWLGIAVAIVTVIATTQAIYKSCQDNGEPKTAQYYGVLRDDKGKPVAGATIRIKSSKESGQLLGVGKTKPNGSFTIVVKAKHETTVWVTVAKGGKVGFTGMQVLSGSNKLTFKAQP